MTVSKITPVNNYTGNGSTTTFDFDFLIEDESELLVQYTDSDGVQTTLTLDEDYTINEVGNEEGSYITFPIDKSSYGVLTSDEVITLALQLDIEQEKEYANSSKFLNTTLEWSLDYITRILQIMNRYLERCIKVQEGGQSADELLDSLLNAQTLASSSAELAQQYAQQAQETVESAEETLQNLVDEELEEFTNSLESDFVNQSKALETGNVSTNAQVYEDVLSYYNSAVSEGTDTYTLEASSYDLTGSDFTSTGDNITISLSGEASDFSLEDYITCTQSTSLDGGDSDTSNSFEIDIKFTTGTLGSAAQAILAYSDYTLLEWQTDGTMSYFEGAGTSNITYEENTTYWVRFSGTFACGADLASQRDVTDPSNPEGDDEDDDEDTEGMYTINVYYSTDGVNYTFDTAFTVDESDMTENTSTVYIGTDLSTYFTGSVDLTGFSISIDGTAINGGSTLTEQSGETTFEIPYVLTKTGSKIALYKYYEYVQLVYEAYGHAPYYTIDLDNEQFSLPMGEIYGMINKVSQNAVDNLNLSDYTTSSVLTETLGSYYTKDETDEAIANVSVDLSEYTKTADLAAVATTGSYNDLTDTPTDYTTSSELTEALASYYTKDETDEAIANVSVDLSEYTKTADLAAVATTGSYNDLTDTPASYELPTASTTTLGGVKIDGSTITITNGVISAAVSVDGSGLANYYTNDTVDSLLENKADIDLSDLDDTGLDKINQSKALETGALSSDTDVYADVLSYAHSTFDESKFTAAGSPTVTDDGIASGFSGSDYLSLDSSGFFNDNWNFKINLCVKFDSSVVETSEIFRIDWTFRCRTVYDSDSGNHILYLFFPTGTAYIPLSFNLENEGWETGDDIYIEMISNGTSQRSASISKDNINKITITNTDTLSDDTPYEYDTIYIGRYSDDLYSLNEIDLKYFAVYIDDELVFTGNQTGTDTLAINDEEVEIPYILSKTGSKIVDYAYYDEIEALYKQEGYAPYYTIDEENQTFSLPMGEIYGMINKISENTVSGTDLSNYVTTSALEEAGYVTSSEVTTAIESYGYQTEDEVNALITAALEEVENGTY